MDKELSQWAAAVRSASSPAELAKAEASGVQHYTNVILAAINGTQLADMPFVLAALQVVHDKMLESEPRVKAAYDRALKVARACASAMPFTSEGDIMSRVLRSDDERREFMDTATRLLKVGMPKQYIVGEVLALMGLIYKDGTWERQS